MEAFQSRDMLARTPDLIEVEMVGTPPNSETAEANPLTPPSSESQGEIKSDPDDDGHIVNIIGPELRDDSGDINVTADTDEHRTIDTRSHQLSLDSILMRARKVLGDEIDNVANLSRISEKEPETSRKDVTEDDTDDGFVGVENEVPDRVVDEMIQEGIRQATEDDNEDELDTDTKTNGNKTDEVNSMQDTDQFGHIGNNARHQGGEIIEDIGENNVDFEEIKGPEFKVGDDDDYGGVGDDDDIGSVRSAEELIVIDKSMHMSPQRTQGTVYTLILNSLILICIVL